MKRLIVVAEDRIGSFWHVDSRLMYGFDCQVRKNTHTHRVTAPEVVHHTALEQGCWRSCSSMPGNAGRELMRRDEVSRDCQSILNGACRVREQNESELL